jgi:hypothetical protein
VREAVTITSFIRFAEEVSANSVSLAAGVSCDTGLTCFTGVSGFEGVSQADLFRIFIFCEKDWLPNRQIVISAKKGFLITGKGF